MGIESGTDSRRLQMLKVLVGAWILLWVVIGVLTAIRIHELTRVSNTLVRSGEALESAGSALQALGELPVVGERTGRLGREVLGTADEIQATGASSRETVIWLSALLGVAIALIPTSPIVGVYLQMRISLARQKKGIREALDRPDQHSALEQFLAHRAVQNLSFEVLQNVSSDPLGDLQRGSYRRLANAELTRLGLAGERK